jgi:glycosyltransferase involved in cell wall biosynthesis
LSRVSVIVPARDAVTTIESALASLVPDASLIGEILLIDDGSLDGTADRAKVVAKRLGLPLEIYRICAGSAGSTRNAGIDQARCSFVYFLDADDALVPGGLGLLVSELDADTDAGIAIGASIRKSPGQADLIRTPSGYGNDRIANAELYLLNGAPPISMGSGMVRINALAHTRFPESIAIDEDTWFWSALLARSGVVAFSEPVLHYHLDVQRTAQRYLGKPQQSWLAISREFRRLGEYGVSDKVLDWRKAWLAQRFVRQLIKHGRWQEAVAMLRPVLAHPSLRRELRTTRYRIISRFGLWLYGAPRSAPAQIPKHREHRTLVLCHDPAWPPVSGADLRNCQNATSAARCGPTLLVSLRAHDPSPARPDFTVTSLTHRQDPRTPSLNWPRSRIEPRIPRLALDRLLDEVRRFRPDTVIVEGISLQALLPALRSYVRQLIIDMHNIESDLARQMPATGIRRATGKFNTALMSWREACALKTADRVWTCTRADRERLLEKHRVTIPVDIVPNGIPRGMQTPADLPDSIADRAAAPHILFVGHLGYRPNVDAASRLARSILPILRKSFPQAVLLLAGRYPKQAVRELAGMAGVELHENPADLAPLFARAHLSIVPLSAGGGSRIKILEAAAWGIPVVATPLAAEGLDLENGRHILLGETDSELAALAVGLLKDRDRFEHMRHEAHALVAQRYGPREIARAVCAGLGLEEQDLNRQDKNSDNTKGI